LAANIPQPLALAPIANDGAGKTYMFGGSGPGASAIYNQLWMYDSSTGYWVKLTGASSAILVATSVSGTKGTPSTSNTPASLYGASMALDESGYLWLFGGMGGNGNTINNNMWRYNISTKEWTWMYGSNADGSTTGVTAVYGTKGTEAAANTPPSLYRGVMWSDKQGSLWVFGGMNGNGYLNNTLWRYRKSTGYWTWMGGLNGISDTTVLYGLSGVEAASYTPQAWSNMSIALDESGYVWLWGGQKQGGYWQNALWRFNTATSQWAWVSGDPTAVTIYSSAGAAWAQSTNYYPGGRNNSSMWYDKHGYIWVFGGYGDPISGGPGYMNDLWRYNIATKQWAFISGTYNAFNKASVFATQGYILQTNVLGARNAPIAWYDGTYAYVFGANGYDVVGSGAGYLNTFQRTKLYTN